MSDRHTILLTLTDGELRQAISEWVERHTVFAVKSYVGIVPSTTPAPQTGTSGFPSFKLGVEVREGVKCPSA